MIAAAKSGSVGLRAAPTTIDSVQVNGVRKWQRIALPNNVSGVPTRSGRLDSRHPSRRSLLFIRMPSVNKTENSAIVKNSVIGVDVGSTCIQPAPPLPAIIPATRNRTAVERTLL